MENCSFYLDPVGGVAGRVAGSAARVVVGIVAVVDWSGWVGGVSGSTTGAAARGPDAKGAAAGPGPGEGGSAPAKQRTSATGVQVLLRAVCWLQKWPVGQLLVVVQATTLRFRMPTTPLFSVVRSQ